MKKVIPLNVAGAYHSRLMEPARAAFAAFLAAIPFARPAVPRLHEHDRHRPSSDPAAIKAALVRQVVSPVLWEDCMRAAAAAGRRPSSGSSGRAASSPGLARRTDKAWGVRSFSEYADLAA